MGAGVDGGVEKRAVSTRIRGDDIDPHAIQSSERERIGTSGLFRCIGSEGKHVGRMPLGDTAHRQHGMAEDDQNADVPGRCVRRDDKSLKEIARAISLRVIRRQLSAGKNDRSGISMEDIHRHSGLFHGVGAVQDYDASDLRISKSLVAGSDNSINLRQPNRRRIDVRDIADLDGHRAGCEAISNRANHLLTGQRRQQVPIAVSGARDGATGGKDDNSRRHDNKLTAGA